MYFTGWSITILFVPFAADKFGRKWIFTLSMVATSVCMVLLYVSRSLEVTIAIMFVAGMATSGRVTVGYVFAAEFLTPKWQVVFGTAFNLLDGASYLITTAYFDFVSDHYFWCGIIGAIMGFLSVIGCIIFMTESPLWMLKMGRVEESKLILKRMMKVNGVLDDEEIAIIDTFSSGGDRDQINQDISTITEIS